METARYPTRTRHHHHPLTKGRALAKLGASIRLRLCSVPPAMHRKSRRVATPRPRPSLPFLRGETRGARWRQHVTIGKGEQQRSGGCCMWPRAARSGTQRHAAIHACPRRRALPPHIVRRARAHARLCAARHNRKGEQQRSGGCCMWPCPVVPRARAREPERRGRA